MSKAKWKDLKAELLSKDNCCVDMKYCIVQDAHSWVEHAEKSIRLRLNKGIDITQDNDCIFYRQTLISILERIKTGDGIYPVGTIPKNPFRTYQIKKD